MSHKNDNLKVKPSKLSFKGSSNRSNLAAVKQLSKSADQDSVSVPEKVDSPKEKYEWIIAEKLCDLAGPLFILQLDPTTDTYRSIVYKAKDNKIDLRMLPFQATSMDDIQLACPSDVEQVALGQWMGGIPSPLLTSGEASAGSTFSLKTPFGRYVSSDRLGQVRLDKEAVGDMESWIPTFQDGLIAFKNVGNKKYLSLDWKGIRNFRADSETIGKEELFLVKCQADKRNKVRAQFDETHVSVPEQQLHILPSNFERDQILRYQSSKYQKYQRLDAKGRIELALANKEGKLHETLLERRVKSKSDKFCK